MPTKTQKAMGTLVGGHCSGDFGQVGELEKGFSHPTSYSGWWALLRSIPAGLGVGFKQCPPYKMLWLVGIAQINSGRIGGWFQAMPTLQNALVGGHCSGEFQQGWGLVSSNAHPTKA
ncbi:MULTISPECIES: hypothetical protein [unclassified Moorena]|uniref:hypothetical protein n=1 Tax=unclassified Moorena TaxID=2683338 RepID=UPI0014010C66|nr:MULTISPECIES: hypothetical protein [unclassified Moorena]NEO12048.1 hypothetical protein [Moorena sp. SIO3E8]NEQ03492.1 hypothetical protein [Moorena sp. SIO3F7]NEQ62522.1 hypothetical protein [Moorena sp. SIO4A1]